MKESPIQATIGFVIDILGLRPENFDGAIETPAVISDIPEIEDLPINVPEGGFGIFPLPPTNPNYTPPFSSPFFPPPAEPIDPNDRNQNGIPDDIDALLG
tara:strand:+ start:210 stop:509 length:300 start_codon:yes stop_codon:yes gene_type:complete